MKTNSAIWQENSLSPLLFSIIMAKIIAAVKAHRHDYKLRNQHLNKISYVDDAALAEFEDDLQRLLFIFKTSLKFLTWISRALKLNSMMISREPLRCKLEINNYSTEHDLSFNYFGMIISSYRNWKEDVKRQINKAATILEHLKQVICRNKYLSHESIKYALNSPSPTEKKSWHYLK